MAVAQAGWMSIACWIIVYSPQVSKFQSFSKQRTLNASYDRYGRLAKQEYRFESAVG
jgi:hypothetical protein